MKKGLLGMSLMTALIVSASSVYADVTAGDIFAKTELKSTDGGICVMIDCSAAFVEDMYAHSNYRIYARFANKAEYESLLSTTTCPETDLFKVLIPEYIPVSDNKIPFPDHYVNLLVVNNTTISDGECERVVSPNYPYFNNITSGTVPDAKTKPYPVGMYGNRLPDENVVIMDSEIQYPLLSKWIDQINFVEVYGNAFYPQREHGFHPGNLGYILNSNPAKARSAFNGELLYDSPGGACFILENKRWNFESGSLKKYSALNGEYDNVSISVNGATQSFIGIRDNIAYFYGNSKFCAVNMTTESVMWTQTISPALSGDFYSAKYTITDSVIFYINIDGTVKARSLTDGTLLATLTEEYDEENILMKGYGNILCLGDRKGRDRSIDVYELTENNPGEYSFTKNSTLTESASHYNYGLRLTGFLKPDETNPIKILTDRGVFDKGGNHLGDLKVDGCSGEEYFYNNINSMKRGPTTDFLTGKKQVKSGNKAPCMKGTKPINGNVYQAAITGGCTCYPSFSIFGDHVYGGGDAGFDFDFDPVTAQKTFQESGYDTIDAPLVTDKYDWATFKKNNKHSAYSPVVTKETVDGSWGFQIPFDEGQITPAVTAENYAFVGTEGGYLYCLEVDDAAQATTQVWKKRLPNEIRVSPTVWNSRLYVGCEDGMLYCFEAKSGDLLWRFMAGPKNRKIRFDNKLKSTWPVSSTVLIEEVEGTNYAFFVAGRLACDGTYAYKLNPITGEQIWRTNIGAENELLETPNEDISNATIITIGKGCLWVGQFRLRSFAGVDLITGEAKKQSYPKKHSKGSRAVYTAFFKDYLFYGGQELYPLRNHGTEQKIREGAAQTFKCLKIEESGFATPLYSGETRRIEPGFRTSLAWDEAGFFFDGYNLYDSDKIEAKLNETYEEGFVPEEYFEGHLLIQWSEKESVYMYGGGTRYCLSPLITETAFIGVRNVADYCNVYRKDSSQSMVLQQAINSQIVQNGAIINRNGVLILSSSSNGLEFFDMGDAPGTAHSLTVNSGSGGSDYLPNALVRIKANSIPSKKFISWSGDTAHLSDPALAIQSVIMPDQDITLTAEYEDVSPVSLTVNKGEGSGVYYDEYIASINADNPEGTLIFDQWTGDTATIKDGNVYLKDTEITVPAADITTSAAYREKSSILVDFGLETKKTSGMWNNYCIIIDENGNGKFDASGTLPNVILESGAFQGSFELASDSSDNTVYEEKTSGAADYPEAAKGDSLSTRYQNINLYVSSLNNDCKYIVKLLVYPDGNNKTKYYINDMGEEDFLLETAGDVNNTKDFMNISPVDGQIHIQLKGPGWKHLSVLDIEEAQEPLITWNPEHGDTKDVTTDITISFDRPIRNLDNSEIINVNVAELVTLKINDENGGDRSFVATINSEKTVITINPDENLEYDKGFFVVMGAVESYENISTEAENIIFRTIDVGENFLKVENGTGDGKYDIGTVIDISATVPGGKHFVNWTGGAGAYGNAGSADTTYRVVGGVETITANVTNDAPTISSIGNTSVNEDSLLVFEAKLYSSIPLKNLGGLVFPIITSPCSTTASGNTKPSSSRYL